MCVCVYVCTHGTKHGRENKRLLTYFSVLIMVLCLLIHNIFWYTYKKTKNIFVPAPISVSLYLSFLSIQKVIIAVTTYKPLQSFVAATLLPRLITKKIWTIPQLWEGFIRCARAIVPHSYGALVQLPPEQLREVVHKQPMLKEGLVNYAKSSTLFLCLYSNVFYSLLRYSLFSPGQSTNKARMISILGILNEASEQAS